MMDESFQRNEERIKRALRAARMGIWELDFQTGHVIWSGEIEALLGLQKGSLDGNLESLLNCVHPEDRHVVSQTINACLDGSEKQDDFFVEHRVVWPDGTVHWLQATGAVFRDDQGQPQMMSGTTADITQPKQAEIVLQTAHDDLEQRVRQRTAELTHANEILKREIENRKRVEAILREEQERLSLAIVGTGGALWDEKIDPAITNYDDLVGNSFLSPQENDLLGYTGPDASPLSLHTWDEHVLPEDRADRERRQRDHFEGKTAYLDHEYRVQQKDGSIRWIHGRSQILRDDQGRPLRWIGIDWDVTEKKQAEEELHRYRESLETLVEERTAELLEANVRLEAEIRERRQAEIERQRLQDQLLQSQKMEAVGRLTAGIAHDFNNLLMVINGYADQIQDEMPPEDPLRKPAEKIAQAGWHAADLVSQLMSFSRKQILQPKILNLSQVVAGIHTMLGRTIGEDIQMEINLAADLWMVEADPSQVEQVLVNLVVNARDAMPRGGKLTIETSNSSLNEEFSANHIDVSPGDYVLVTVNDTGEGMSDDVKTRLFEPFFTTKELGKGTGLGLATVYGIVKQSGGHIWIDSVKGRGSTFRIYFPRAGADNRTQPESI